MRWPPWMAALMVALLSPRAALADDSTMACIDANADAQELEHAGKLREAKSKLVSCASASCPVAVRSDCAAILARVDAEQPTVTIEAHDETGAGTTRVHVWIDDTLVPDAAAGRAVEVDPGEHVVRAELGATKREMRFVSVEGEKDRRIAFDFAAPRSMTTTSSRFVVPWLSWTFAGVSVLSAGAFVYFGLTGNGIKNRLDTTCSATRTCNRSEYFDMATSYEAADVFAAVAGGALVVAVVTAIVWPRAKRSSPVGFSIDGAGASFHGTF